jgi:hypothetical protein
MSRIAFVGKDVAGLTAHLNNTDFSVVKSFASATDFREYLDYNKNAHLEFDKIVLLQNSLPDYATERAVKVINDIQKELITLDELNLDFHILLTDEELYTYYLNSIVRLFYPKISILLFRKVGNNDIYSALIGNYSQQGIYYGMVGDPK